LGKRTLRDLYNAPQIFTHLLPRPKASALRPPNRPFATVTEHNQDPPSGFPPPHSSENSTSKLNPSSSASDKFKPASPTGKPPSFDVSTKSALSSSSPERSQASSDSGDWELSRNRDIEDFSQLPSGRSFGVNQHIIINEEFKEALRQMLWKFRAPIRYAFAYGSGVFPQKDSGRSLSTNSTLHPSPPEAVTKVQNGNPKMIDFIFGVSYTQHWHSINLQEHRDHYSAVGSLGSYAVSKIQDSFGAGCYFNPYVTVNGTLIKYGVVNLDTLCRDLSEWDTLYLAGRLHKPVKILRDNASVRLANQMNLISAVRTALLLLPPDFTEEELYSTIAGISYTGDPRMTIGGDDPRKVHNIVHSQLANFRRLYAPLIDSLPNISFNDPACGNRDWIDDPTVNAKLAQDMDPVKRGNMVRRLPKSFREKLYFEYQAKFKIPRGEFNKMLERSIDDDKERIKRREGGEFEQRIAKDTEGIKTEVRQVIEKTVRWPSWTQSLKGPLTAGVAKSWRYAREKRAKNRASVANIAENEKAEKEKEKAAEGKDKAG
jgi:translocator assembly and maintenance protein 41